MKRKLNLFLVNTIILFASLGFFIFSRHFSSDDYFCCYQQIEEGFGCIFMNGRLPLGLLYILLDLVNINVVKHQFFFGSCLILMFALACTMLTLQVHRLSGLTNQKSISIYLLNLGSLLFILNPLIVDWLWFSLAYLQWGGSTLLAICASCYFISAETTPCKRAVITTLLLLAAIGFYQTVIVYYVLSVMMFVFLKRNGTLTKDTIGEILAAAIPAIVSMLIEVAFMKLCRFLIANIGGFDLGTRIAFSVSQIPGIIRQYTLTLLEFVKTGLFFWPRCVIRIAASLFCVLLAAEKLIFRSKWNFAYMLLVPVSGVIVDLLLHLGQADFAMTGRMIISLMFLFTIAAWMGMLAGNKYTQYLAAVLSAVFLVLNFAMIQIHTSDCRKQMDMEQQEAVEIIDTIEAYEASQGVQIQSIGFITSGTQHPAQSYFTQQYGGEFLARSLAIDWSNIQLLNYYSGRNWAKITDIPEWVSSQALSWDGTELALSNQLIFDGNIAYIYVY